MIRLWETRRRQGIYEEAGEWSPRAVSEVGAQRGRTKPARRLNQGHPSDVHKIPCFQTDLAAGMISPNRGWNALKSERTRGNYSFLQLNRVGPPGDCEAEWLSRSIQGQLSRALKVEMDRRPRPALRRSDSETTVQNADQGCDVSKGRQGRNSSRFAGRRLR